MGWRGLGRPAPAGCGAEPREENLSDFSFKTSIFVTGELKQTWLYQGTSKAHMEHYSTRM